MRLWFSLIIVLLATSAWGQGDRMKDDNKAYFYLGTYSAHLQKEPKAKAGISRWSVNTETGQLTLEGGPWPTLNGSFVILSEDQKHLYSVNEVGNYEGTNSGYLTHFSINPGSTALTPNASRTSHGGAPAYLSMDRAGKHLLLANYSGGNVVVYPIGADGALGEPTANVHHTGSGINPRRQEAPHPHSIITSPDDRFVFVPDLGLDKIKVYAFDGKTGTLDAKPELDVDTPPGSGPRHLTFHPSGKYAFLSLEMGNTLAAYRYANGAFTEVGIYETLPEDFKGNSSTAEVRVSPNGKNVYISNRGHDSIAAFNIDAENGSLERIQIVSTEGKTPRNFALDPGGKIMVVGNQETNTLVSFRVDQNTGRLKRISVDAKIPAPVYICFY